MKLSDVINQLASKKKHASRYAKFNPLIMFTLDEIDQMITVLADTEDQIDSLTRGLNESEEHIRNLEDELQNDGRLLV